VFKSKGLVFDPPFAVDSPGNCYDGFSGLSTSPRGRRYVFCWKRM